MKLSLINFIDRAMKQGMHIPLFNAKDGEPKDQTVKSAPNTGQAS